MNDIYRTLHLNIPLSERPKRQTGGFGTGSPTQYVPVTDFAWLTVAQLKAALPPGSSLKKVHGRPDSKTSIYHAYSPLWSVAVPLTCNRRSSPPEWRLAEYVDIQGRVKCPHPEYTSEYSFTDEAQACTYQGTDNIFRVPDDAADGTVFTCICQQILFKISRHPYGLTQVKDP